MEKIDIRPWKLEDAADLANALNNKNIQDNLRDGLPYPYTAEDATEYIEHILKLPENNAYSWAITLNNRAVGSIGFFRKDNIHFRTAELGYYISEIHWGKGIMTTAVKKGCDAIFSTTDIIRIFAEPYASNQASCKVLEKAGFVCEGTLKSNAYKNGILLDMKMYALIQEED